MAHSEGNSSPVSYTSSPNLAAIDWESADIVTRDSPSFGQFSSKPHQPQVGWSRSPQLRPSSESADTSPQPPPPPVFTSKRQVRSKSKPQRPKLRHFPNATDPATQPLPPQPLYQISNEEPEPNLQVPTKRPRTLPKSHGQRTTYTDYYVFRVHYKRHQIYNEDPTFHWPLFGKLVRTQAKMPERLRTYGERMWEKMSSSRELCEAMVGEEDGELYLKEEGGGEAQGQGNEQERVQGEEEDEGREPCGEGEEEMGTGMMEGVDQRVPWAHALI